MIAGREAIIGTGLLLGLIAALFGTNSSADGLPALGANPSETSVSGLSSGGYMAGQYQVAHSKTVIGAGIVAAGPYGCAYSAIAQSVPFFPTALAANLAQAESSCTADQLAGLDVLNGARLAQQAARFADGGRIDPVLGLKRSKVYLFTGRDDRTVAAKVVEAARDFYLAAGVPPENILFLSGHPGGHAFLTEKEGAACSRSEPPYLDNCNYDQAGALLGFIYGSLRPKGQARAENFIIFDQQPYASGDASLANKGLVYLPSSCRTAAHCKIHVVFHGCRQSRILTGDAFTHGSGFADWAESNEMIILFPQMERSALNPESCWDWWGYTGLEFLTRDAPQIKAVAAMVARLAEPREGGPLPQR
jgi:poly(3-hydroxybutyrate) depolymerase